MFNIIPLFLIIISLGVIVVIIARKYPELTLLDLDTIPERKEKQKKKEILTRKANKRSKDKQAKFLDRLTPVQHAWKKSQTSFRTYVKKLKEDVEESKKPTSNVQTVQHASEAQSTKEETVDSIIKKGRRSLDEKKFQEAENTFIGIIENDSKHAPAYEGLGDVYAAQQQYDEATETYLYARKLDPQNISLLVKLAVLSEQSEAWIDAIQYYQEAMLVDDTNHEMFAKLSELLEKANEPQAAYEAISQAVDLHPKHLPYLDSLVETSIMVQDKNRAEEVVQAIRMIDPEYTRLGLLKDRIAEMQNA